MTSAVKLSQSASSPQVLQTIAWLRKANFRAVPLRHRSKAALNQNYVALDYSPPSDDLWRTRELGVGVVTGPAHHGPVDADLDCPEALFFAPRFLPPTDAVFGRASKPRSHQLYRVDSTTFEKIAFLDPIDNTTLLELRGDAGHQTCMPGCLHEDTGELVEWETVAFPEVPTVSSVALLRAAQKTALACLVARRVWAPGYHNDPTKLLSGVFYYMEWTLAEAESFIQALMEYSDDQDKSRIPTVRATYRRGEAGKKVAGAGVLRKQLKDDALVDRILELAGSPSINVVQEYNDRYAVVSVEGKFRIVDTEVPAGEPPVFYAKDDFLNYTAVDLSEMQDDKGRRIPKARAWLTSPRRRQYRSIDFLPGIEQGDEPTGVLNLWSGFAVQPLLPERMESNGGTGSCSAWLELLAYVVCGEDLNLYTWMINWFANIVREPMNKAPTAPVIIGEHGIGKTLLIKYFGRILGLGYVPVTDEKHIHGNFNKHLASALLMHSEEALYAGDRRHRGTIKSLISDEFRLFESKGIDAKRVRNFLRLILTSNEDHAAPAEATDRRFTVIHMRDRRISPELEKRVVAELEGDGPAALHRFLLDLDYDPQLIRTNVKNTDLVELKSINMDPVQNWWYDTLSQGLLLPDTLAWAQDNPDDGRSDWPIVVSVPALYLSMTFKLKARNIRTVPSEVSFGMQLRKFVGRSLCKSRRDYDNPLIDGVPPEIKMLNSRQNVFTNMPDLKNCRAAFEKHLGQELDWPDEGEARKIKQHEKF